MSVDLHTHSTASDGTDSPAELARLAREVGLSVLALTDHDTTAGLAECGGTCEEAGVAFVPGIELSCDRGRPRGTLHVLGYFVDEADPSLGGICAAQHAARAERNPTIIARLNEMGIEITMDDVIAHAGAGTIGRPHIAAALIAMGHAESVPDAFDRYIGQGRPAYARKDNLPPDRAIEAIHHARGLAVLAHPYQLRCDDEDDLRAVISGLVDMGLDGIEVFHSDHDGPWIDRCASLSCHFGLVPTGGSDYHGSRKRIALGALGLDDSIYQGLLDRREKRAP